MNKDTVFRTEIIFLMLTLVACRQVEPPEFEWTNEISRTYYDFDRESLLESIAIGEQDLFVPITEQEANSSERAVSGAFPWHQVDYLNIARVFFESVLDASLDEWEISELTFRLQCSEASVGYDWGAIDFFKLEPLGDSEMLLEISLFIEPVENLITLYEGEKGPYPVVDQQIIALDTMTISADDALDIAQEAGGFTFHERNDWCNINILYSHRDNGWRITYYVEGALVQDILIEPYTGEYQILDEP